MKIYLLEGSYGLKTVCSDETVFMGELSRWGNKEWVFRELDVVIMSDVRGKFETVERMKAYKYYFGEDIPELGGR